MDSEIYKLRIRGTRPLLMNSCSSMLEEESTKPKRGKGEYKPKEEAEKLLYKEGNDIVVPSFCVLACLRKSATNFKVPGRGKKTYKDFIYSGIKIDPDNISLISEDGWVVDLRIVVINRARVPKARPKFENWELEFTIDILDPIITPSSLKEILIDAGKYNGLLDFRPLFGLFEVVTFEKVQ